VTGFLLDENLPNSLRFTPSLPVEHVRDLGQSLADKDIWTYERMLISEPPPKVIHLRFGNMCLVDFHAHLAKVWPRIEELLVINKLINIYVDRLEAVAQKNQDEADNE
jgi:predicted nuclease of predicted toxin-antitoxin system